MICPKEVPRIKKSILLSVEESRLGVAKAGEEGCQRGQVTSGPHREGALGRDEARHERLVQNISGPIRQSTHAPIDKRDLEARDVDAA